MLLEAGGIGAIGGQGIAGAERRKRVEYIHAQEQGQFSHRNRRLRFKCRWIGRSSDGTVLVFSQSSQGHLLRARGKEWRLEYWTYICLFLPKYLHFQLEVGVIRLKFVVRLKFWKLPCNHVYFKNYFFTLI